VARKQQQQRRLLRLAYEIATVQFGRAHCLRGGPLLSEREYHCREGGRKLLAAISTRLISMQATKPKRRFAVLSMPYSPRPYDTTSPPIFSLFLSLSLSVFLSPARYLYTTLCCILLFDSGCPIRNTRVCGNLS